MCEKKGKEMQKPHQKSLFDVECHLFLVKVRVKIKARNEFKWIDNKSRRKGLKVQSNLKDIKTLLLYL